jgi:ADP-ribose pyrophosphatase YjhB (NUDIX family)
VGEAILDDVRRQLQEQIGIDEIAALEAHLTAIVGDSPVRADAPSRVGTSV